MKKLAVFIGLAALAMQLSSAAMAAGPDLFAGFGVGIASISAGNGSKGDGTAVTGFASGAYNFTPTLGAQGDVVVSGAFLDWGNDNLEDLKAVDAAIHGFYRDPDKFLIGGLLQFSRDSIEPNYAEHTTSDRRYAGLDLQAFLGNFTLYGQAGVMDVSVDPDDLSASGPFATAELRVFPTPNVKLDLHAGFSSLTLDGFDEDNTQNINVGFGAEYRFDNLPISLFAKVDSTSSKDDYDQRLTVQRVLAGITGSFGAATLQDRDRNGASLKPLPFDSAQFYYGVR